MNNNNHQSANIISSNSFNSNTFSSNNKKSRSKKHSEDYSIKSEIRGIPNDFKDIQTFPAHFLPLSNRMSSSSKIDSSNQTSQKQLTKKILERIESEQNKLKFLDEDKSFENDEEDRNKSLTEIEEDILHTISNRHSSSGRINNCESKSDSMQEESLHSNNRDSIKKKVTFIQKITRAKTYDINLKGSKKKIDSSKNSFDGSLNNSSNVNINSDKKKKTTAYGPERIYDILKNKQEEKGANKIFKNIAVMMLVNHFVRQIKLRSGNFGILGNRQLKILNDLCNPYILDKFSKNQEEHTNILVRMIRKNQLNQKISRRPNFLIRWGIILRRFLYKHIFSKIDVLMPNHKFKFSLNCFVLILSLFEFGYIPLSVTFALSDDNPYLKIRTILLLVLVFDILLNFNTGYFHRGTLITTRKEILKRYVKANFWLEAISILPSLILNLLPINFLNAYKPEINFLEFFFLLRIIFFDKMIRKICDFYQSTEFLNNFISLLKLCVWSLFVAHLCACMFHYVSILDSSDYKKTWVTLFEHSHEDNSLYSEYITSLYWSVTTMVTVGYGDVIPVTPHEKIVAITAMLGACCVFAYIMNSIGGIINSFNNRQTVLRQKIQAVNIYLDMKEIDNDLRIRIRKYLEYLYEERNAMMKEGHSVVSNLSTSLKTEIFQRLNGEIIVNVPVLINNFSLKLLSSLTLFMNEVNFTPEDFIFDENVIDNQELFFIYEGEVEIYIQNTTGFREDTHLNTLKKGEYFGEIAFFTGQARTASAISLEFSTLIGIRRLDFITVIKNSSFDYEKLCMIRDNITLYQNYNNLSIKCYCCNYNNHIAKNCPMVHVIINPQRVIRDHIKIEPTSRRQFPRFQKKFNAMTHLEAMIRACIKLHRTTTLEISTYTVEQDEEEEEDDKEEEPDLSPSKNLSQFRRFGSNNPHSLQNITAIRSKTSLKNTQGVSEENTPDDKDNKKYFNWERRGRREHNLTQNNMMGTTITNKQVGGTFISGSVGFETYISNMNTVIENERVPSPLLKRKKRPSTQTITPKTSGTELKRDGSISPLKKKSQNMTEIDGRYQEHQKLVAEALMLQGISNTGPQENFIKLSYNELLNQFDKLKNFEIYFPYNNVDMIVEIIKTWQKNAALKKRKSRIKKNVTGHQNFSTLYNQMTFNQVFKKDTINTHNSNYEDLMYRRALTQNEGSPAKKLRLLPTKSLNFNKGINAIKQNLKKSQKMRKKIKKSGFWMCFTCKKKNDALNK